MAKLFILSGPPVVGKTALADKVVENNPDVDFFTKDTVGYRRPSDRDTEKRFRLQEQFDQSKLDFGVLPPYIVRGKEYGLPTDSYAELKENPRIICLDDFNLISSLGQVLDTVPIYVTAPIDTIIGRINQREDLPERKQESIASVKCHLEACERFRELFDYEIDNAEDLEIAAAELLGIVEDELSAHRKVYNGFLVSDWYTDRDEALQNPLHMIENLQGFELTTHQELSQPPCAKKGSYHFRFCSTAMHLVTIEDKEDRGIYYGSLRIEGPKNDVSQTAEILEAQFPVLRKYGCKQQRKIA